MSERKTLSIKSTMWHTPTLAQSIEEALASRVKEILCDYEETPAKGYDEDFRTFKQIKDSLQNSYNALKENIKYPKVLEQLFDQITSNICTKLNEKDASKFNRALSNLNCSKASLPKIVEGPTLR